MAFDGILIAGLVAQLQQRLTGGRITKIAQTEADKLVLTVKNSFPGKNETIRTQEKLVISVNPSLPLLYLTQDSQNAPLQAPTFCMVLRKHLNNCKITDISQIGLERVVCFSLEHLNEMGDFCQKKLYVELMGKHSNIIFCDEKDTIIDSIKHIPPSVSSIREVLPGRSYFIPNTKKKKDPFTVTKGDFFAILEKPLPPDQALYGSLTGFSRVMANELLYRASLSDRSSTAALSKEDKDALYQQFLACMVQIKQKQFCPAIFYEQDVPVEFSAVPLTSYSASPAYRTKAYDDISLLLYEYYHTKEALGRIRQKSADLRHLTQTASERVRKKYDLQKKQLKDTQKRDKYRVYGELLTTYGYSLSGGETDLTCENYYTQEEITIPLDPTKSAVENAKHYFERYAKQKRTYEALCVQLEETEQEILHLDSISNALDIAQDEEDLAAIRRELAEAGYLKRHAVKQKNRTQRKPEKSKPLHFRSTDGFDIYVGKNNFQNDALTFQLAANTDWWFHAKKMAGSHVIVKALGKDLPDRTFEEAARLAAYYSKARNQKKAEIDYVQKKHIKKPNGAKPGFVVYYTNYSMTIPTDISGIEQVTDGAEKKGESQ